MEELIVIALSTVISCLIVIYIGQVVISFVDLWLDNIETKKEFLLKLIPFIWVIAFAKQLTTKLKLLS